MLVTHQLITQVFLAPEITKKLLTFDHLRWYRSSTGRNGFYEQATSEIPAAAALRGRPTTRALAGKVVRLRINGVVEIEVTFAGPDPLEVQDVAEQLSAASPLLIVSAAQGVVQIATVLTGTAASLEVLASDGAPYLGLLVGRRRGSGCRQPLAPGSSEYQFSDHQSSPLTCTPSSFARRKRPDIAHAASRSDPRA